MAETINGAMFSADCLAKPGQMPEELGNDLRMEGKGVGEIVIGACCRRLNPCMFAGQLACKHLLEEIKRGGCVDTQSQALCLLLMVLCPEVGLCAETLALPSPLSCNHRLISCSGQDVSKVRLGKLSPFTVQYLRDIKTFFGTTFKITTDADDNSALFVTNPSDLLMLCCLMRLFF